MTLNITISILYALHVCLCLLTFPISVFKWPFFFFSPVFQVAMRPWFMSSFLSQTFSYWFQVTSWFIWTSSLRWCAHCMLLLWLDYQTPIVFTSWTLNRILKKRRKRSLKAFISITTRKHWRIILFSLRLQTARLFQWAVWMVRASGSSTWSFPFPSAKVKSQVRLDSLHDGQCRRHGRAHYNRLWEWNSISNTLYLGMDRR